MGPDSSEGKEKERERGEDDRWAPRVGETKRERRRGMRVKRAKQATRAENRNGSKEFRSKGGFLILIDLAK